MKRKMIGFLTMALAVSAVGTLGSCKDYDDDNRVELQGEYAKLDKDLQDWIKKVEDCKKKCQAFREYLVGSTDWENSNIKDRLGLLDQRLDDLDDTIEILQDAVNGKLDAAGVEAIVNAKLGPLWDAVNGKLDAAGVEAIVNEKLGDLDAVTRDELTQALTQQLETLNGLIDDKVGTEQLNSLLTGYATVSAVETIQSQVRSLMDIISTMDAEDFQNMQTDIIELQNAINGVEGTGGIKSQITDIQNKLTMLENMTGVDEAKVKEMIDANNLLIDTKILTAVNNLSSELLGEGDQTLTLNGINNALTAADTQLKNQIDAITTKMGKFEDQLANLTKNFKQLVTSVIVQGTYNPIFGSLTAPFNVQSNVLAAYYGYAEVGGSFPFTNAGMLVNKNNSLTPEDVNMIGTVRNGSFDFSDGKLLTDGNAGTIYLTINPTAIDFTGLDFALENSVGEESPVKLGMLTPSKKKLTFGWTRGISAPSTNGFYEAQAKIADEDIQKAKLVVDMTKSDIQEIFKDVTSPKDGIDIKNIANKVYSVVNDVCDANAVKAYWGTDANANSTLSQYSIAATAVKPLSFAFMKDYHIDSFYGVDRVKNFINNTIDGININLSFGEITVPEIKKIEIKPLETVDPVTGEKKFEKSVTISTEVEIEGQTINVNLGDYINGKYEVKDETTGEVVGTINLGEMFKDQNITVKTDPVKKTITATGVVDMTDVIEDVYGQITDPIEDVNEMLGQLETFMGDVNKMIEEINGINQKIEDAKDDIASQINKYIDALNKRLCNVVNGIHDRLQPLAIAHNGKEFYTLSEIENMPSKISGNTLHIVPTTYTAELVVPAFKKYVAVVNVFKGSASAQGGDAACLNALKAANNKGGMNTVVAGTTRDVEFVGEKGYTYEIAYSALDYSGKAVTKKYYVTVE